MHDKPLFDKFLSLYPQETSEFTFTNLFCWRLTKNITFDVLEDHLLVSFNKGKQVKFLPPVGPNPVEIIKKIASFYQDRCFVRINDSIAKKLGHEFVIKRDRDQDDYVYKIDDLKYLHGKKYDGKRNLIKHFEEYKPKVCVLNKSEFEDFLNFQQRWCMKHNCEHNPDLLAENIAIEELLYNLEALDVFGICVVIDHKIEAFAIGEAQNGTTVVEHFEKANTDFKGIYQYLLHAFVKTIPDKYTFLNREQDIGIPGLRKSKLSYHPAKMIEKYTAKFVKA
jgi:hypothetical protein